VTIVDEGPDGWTVEALVFDTQRSAVAALLARAASSTQRRSSQPSRHGV